MKIKRSNKGLSQREMSKLIRNKNTINLSSIERRKNARYEKKMKALKFKGLIVLIILTIGLGLFQYKVYGEIINTTNANNINTSIRDSIRLDRIEACYRVKQTLAPDVSDKFITKCATMMGLIYAYESGYGKSNKCIVDKNCMGMKGWSNGKYGFKKFNSFYESKLYFAEKFWKYHYKKNLFTFIYGYKQVNGKYKYGWSYTDRGTYLRFLQTNFHKMDSEINLLLKNNFL